MLGRTHLLLLLTVQLYLYLSQSNSIGTPDCSPSSYTIYSNYSSENITLKGASVHDNDTSVTKVPKSSCDNALSNNTWYRFTGVLQQDRLNVTDRHYKLGLLYNYGGTCHKNGVNILYANVYECDTFLLYNFAKINPGTINTSCMRELQWEPTGICLEDTVEPLNLTTQHDRHSYKVPARLSANATRSPFSPIIVWTGDNGELIEPDRVGFVGTPFNMWSEILVPTDASYTTVQYCVDNSTCGSFNLSSFNLYALGLTGSFQKRKVLFLEATLESNIAATYISWEVNSKVYHASERDVIIDNGSLDNRIQKASITMYNLDFDYNSAKVMLTVGDDDTTHAASSVVSLDDCPSDTYFLKGSCVSCPASSTAPVGSVKIDKCQCNGDTYRSADTCINCPANSTSPDGSLSPEDCMCHADTYSEGGTCKSCPVGYHSEQGSKDRNDCKQDICAVDMYFDKSQGCVPCRVGTHSKEGSTNTNDCKKPFPLLIVLIVSAACLVLIIILITGMMIYKKRRADSTKTEAAVKYTVTESNATVS